MGNSPDGSESPAESGEDGQLTIRIPNPKVYMARQSQWKGRRGKPRCDHCRLNNLKCDRVLPNCNHCAWPNGRECKYTPLPTPAHRGIPRCDRCRSKNLKCDRSLPVCNHCLEDHEEDCNYTPKKRHKVPSDHAGTRDRPVAPYAAKTASFLVSDMPSTYSAALALPESHTIASGSSGGNIFENEIRTSPQIKQYMPRHSPGSNDGDGSVGPEFDSTYQQEGPDGTLTWVRKFVGPPSVSKGIHSSASPGTYHRPFLLDQGMIVTTPHIDPWTNPSFAPLPAAVIQGLRSVNAIEMPTPHAFEEALCKFVAGLSPELRETATFTPEAYAEIARAVAEGRVGELPPRLQMWATFHHARSGSRKYHLILLPRDAFYSMSRAEEEKFRVSYIAQTDEEGEGVEVQAEQTEDAKETSTPDPAAVFERVPVQNQIYDVLVYTHRNHGTAPTMLFEARRIGVATVTWPMVELFLRLCPLCKLRSKGTPRVAPDEETIVFRSR